MNNDNKALKLLIEGGADINATSENGITPLHMACSRGTVGTVKLLIENGADINATDENGTTPLHIACLTDAVDTVKLLIEGGADINATDENGITPLRQACVQGYTETAKALIDSILLENPEEIKPDYIKEDKILASYWDEWKKRRDSEILSLKNDNKALKLLIEGGADINATSENGITPLHIACLTDAVDTVKLLIEGGADINATDKNGITPLHMACLRGTVGTVKLLIENGADINATDENGITPLRQACVQGYTKTAKALIDSILLKNPEAIKPDYIEENKILASYWNEWEERRDSEILSSKKVTFGRISLFDFIFTKNENRLASISCNEGIRDIIINKLDQYPIFAKKIKENFKKGLARNELLNRAKNKFFHENKNAKLDEYCSRMVLEYLDEDSLKSMAKLK